MSYRPICDTWILARSKVKFFGAFPAGFLERARALLGVTYDDPVLHVCSGRVREYPYRGIGKADVTLDIDAALAPDVIGDANGPEVYKKIRDSANPPINAVLADPPYNHEWAQHYAVNGSLPTPNNIVKNSIEHLLPIGGRVGVLSMEWPRYPKEKAKQVALIGVYVGNGNIGRTYAVFERIA
jgi:hypothetical protein